jgi:hypothetical protein
MDRKEDDRLGQNVIASFKYALPTVAYAEKTIRKVCCKISRRFAADALNIYLFRSLTLSLIGPITARLAHAGKLKHVLIEPLTDPIAPVLIPPLCGSVTYISSGTR